MYLKLGNFGRFCPHFIVKTGVLASTHHHRYYKKLNNKIQDSNNLPLIAIKILCMVKIPPNFQASKNKDIPRN